MAKIRIGVINPSETEKVTMEVPNDVAVGDLRDAIVDSMGMPLRGQNERRLRYHLAMRDENVNLERLEEGNTLEGQGIQDGDVLQLTVEMTAGCFLGSVQISLANGQRKPIQDVRVGDALLSGIPASKTFTTAKVAYVFKSTASNYLTLNGTLHVTESHPIWSNGKWISAGKLKTGDVLHDRFGHNVELKSIEHRDKNVEIYNLYISSAEHTFFAENILVHNMNFKTGTQEGKDLSSTMEEIDQTVFPLQYSYAPPKFLLSALTIMLRDTETPHQKLTPQYLTDYVNPYLRAIADLQHLINEIRGRPYQDVEVVNIAQGSALISLSGASEAIELIMSVVIPWRYKHAKNMAKLTENEKHVQIESAKADIIAKHRASAKNKEQSELELAKQRAEVEKLELENKKLRIELEREKIHLALDVLSRIKSDLTEAEKIEYAIKLLKPLDVLISSDVEIKLIQDSKHAGDIKLIE